MRFLKSLKFIFKPRWWTMNNPYCPIWNDQLNKLLDDNDFNNFDEYTANLGGIELWVRNIPYCCMHPVFEGTVRASRLTIERAVNKYKKDKFKWLIAEGSK